MPFYQANIEGLWVFEPRIFEDERGFFYESYNHREFVKATGIDRPFVQDNHSLSKKGVLRGLHFQIPPHDQAKLVRVVQGEVLDVALDIRQNSPSFGQHVAIQLSAENKKQFYIPRGFAHAFVVLSETAELLYKCDNFYAPQFESGVIFNDPALHIDWLTPQEELVVSDKDLKLKLLQDLDSYF